MTRDASIRLTSQSFPLARDVTNVDVTNIATLVDSDFQQEFQISLM